MQIKKYIYGFLLSGSLLLTGCDGLFRDIPNDKLSQESLWGSELLLDEYILPMYRNMNNGFSVFMPTNAFFKSMARIYLPWYTDQITVSKNDWYNTAYGDILKGNSQGITQSARLMWDTYYTQIQSANLLFENSSKIKEGDFKKRVLGEAHFFRGYYYYMLMRQYGGVMLIDRHYDPLVDSTRYERASYTKMIEYIDKEATLAADNLPVKYESTDVGRITKGAALMLKAKAYLWGASDFLQEVEKPYLGFIDNQKVAMLQAAKKAYDEFFALNAYELVPIEGTTLDEIKTGYRKIFLTKNTQESILEVQHSNDGDYDRGNGHKLDRESVSPAYGGTTAAYTPTHNHVMEYGMQQGYTYDANHPYENRDYRFYANVLYDGCNFRGRTMEMHYTVNDEGKEVAGKDLTAYDASESSAVSKTGYYMGKFVDESQVIDNDRTYASKQNYIIWRKAEAMLDYAEISFLLGDKATALDNVNLIRRRAHMHDLPDLTWDQLVNERRVELAFEETTYWDMFRWGTALKEMNGRTNPLKAIKIVRKEGTAPTFTISNMNKKPGRIRYFHNKQYYYPIPWDEIRYHRIPQNPSWEEM